MLPEGMKHAGSSPDADKRALKAQFDPLMERSWWRIEAGRPIPDELQLVFDGVPPGHCTLTVTRRLSVRQFLDRVALIRFEFAGTDYFGVAKP